MMSCVVDLKIAYYKVNVSSHSQDNQDKCNNCCAPHKKKPIASVPQFLREWFESTHRQLILNNACSNKAQAGGENLAKVVIFFCLTNNTVALSSVLCKEQN